MSSGCAHDLSLSKARQKSIRTAPSVGSCEKIEKSGTDSPFRAGQLRILKRLRGAKKVSVPDFSIFSQLLNAGTRLRRNRPLADAWGYLTSDRMRNKFSTVRHTR